MDSIEPRVLELWWAYYQCEPFGSHWEQTASMLAMQTSVIQMQAASFGHDYKSSSVLDFMPADSVPWMKRKRAKAKPKGVTGKTQSKFILQAFGF